MKKFLLFVGIAMLSFASANAQVKFGFGLGYASPMGDASDFLDGGISAHLEVGYGVTEDIDVSFLYQGDFLVGADIANDSYGNLTIGSYLVNTRYFFKKEGFRPYASLGLGMANVGGVELEASNNNSELELKTDSKSNFGIRPALGFKYKVLNFNVAYLSAGKTDLDQSVGDLTVNIGLLFTFGGN
ncbi:outer membrane beta-barrel protein [Aquimarina intermedia]|uniref:Outer membrane protein beta-barrel domain-containing protein n=1 Tax=Aquimarina intermedia TaxID=350814 RepID=A0A5S5C1G3_9FLAO|nr:outer membrane beta-barrel protein [Aquimarina intermedia]TYP72180.1 hypothetical protein BD809_10764 [Aquimarina intermedia]